MSYGVSHSAETDEDTEVDIDRALVVELVTVVIEPDALPPLDVEEVEPVLLAEQSVLPRRPNEKSKLLNQVNTNPPEP